MISAVIVSWSSATAATAVAATAVRSFGRAVESQFGTAVRQVSLGSNAHLVATSSPAHLLDLHVDETTGAVGMVLSTAAYTVDGRRVGAASVGSVIESDTPGVANMASPFAAWWTAARDQPVYAVTDACGLCHLYGWQGDGWAAVSTSSALLAGVTRVDLDEDAIGTFALLGHHVGDQSWFRAIHKLQRGQRACLDDGRLLLTEFPAPPLEAPAENASQTSVVASGRRVLAAAVTAALDAYPGAGMELSGGMDCRAILAAIPPPRRVGMPALTLGPPESPDVRVAAVLAERWRMRHDVIDTQPLAGLEPEEALALVTTAGRRRDFGRDATAGAVLDWVEERAEQGPRLTGQGGEFLRGEYYPGQPSSPNVTEGLVARLAGWRLFLNGPADPALFAPSFLDHSRVDTIGRIRAALDGFGGDWLRACDEIYLRVRMQRWAGAEYAAGTVTRPVLAPYFHRHVLDWGRSIDSVAKRNSRALNAVTAALDWDLAMTPLDTGLRPVDLADPGLRARAVIASTAGRKVVRKVHRRLGGARRSPIGAGHMAGLVREAWASTDSALERVADLSCMNTVTVLEVASGRRAVSAAGVAFLVGVDGALAAAAG